MRHTSLSVAALLAFVMLAPAAALAFDVDTTSGTNPDGSARYSDPDDAPLTGPLGAVTVTPGAQFGSGTTDSSSSSSSSSSGDQGWSNTQLGRVTH
jgi:hypothetical protein